MAGSPIQQFALLVAAIAMLVGVPPVSSAAPVQLHFQGSVSSLDETFAPVLTPGVKIGDSIVLVITFDSSALDEQPFEDRGSYTSTGVPFGISAQVGSLLLSSALQVRISVFDDQALGGGSIRDQYIATASLETPDLDPADQLVVSALQDFSGLALPNDSLPTDQQSLAGFSSFAFAYLIPGTAPVPFPTPITVINGQLHLVPEPSLLLLLFVSIAAGLPPNKWLQRTA